MAEHILAEGRAAEASEPEPLSHEGRAGHDSLGPDLWYHPPQPAMEVLSELENEVGEDKKEVTVG